MVAVQVIGNDTAIAVAGSQGNFELNVYKPVVIFNFLHSTRLLAEACARFREFCVDGIEAKRARIAELVERSLMRRRLPTRPTRRGSRCGRRRSRWGT